MNYMMRIILSVAISLTLIVGCLLTPAAAAEKEEELLRAVEEVVRQYRAEEEVKQEEPAVSQNAAPVTPQSDNTPAQQPQVEPHKPAEDINVNIWQQLAGASPAPNLGTEQGKTSLPTAPPAGNVVQQLQNSSSPGEPTAVAALSVAKDDIIVTIEEALRQYRANDFAGAISNLDYAAQLIRQKKSERMKALLPTPLFGWLAKEPAAKFLGTAVFGGGSTVSRDYYTSVGAALSVEIVSDSPVLQSIIMMLNNPLFAGASGGNLQTVKQQRAIIKYNANDRSGEINIVVDSRFIVTVKGRAVDQSMLLAYAEAVDFEALAKN
ncbi:hypothetical protein [Candidatus Electronema sp. PJ]|uniref:hypothetical protein n=1 Tax=Candidatus Electronema sp. PJ TaxID=3401572 RepID=UPI003AA91209